jgi:hypothetical protein
LGIWALIERIRQLLFARSLLGNPAPPALIPKHALRLCQRLFYPSVSELDIRFAGDRPECFFLEFSRFLFNEGGRCIHQVLHKINETTHGAPIDRSALAPAIDGIVFLIRIPC